eukprot:747819-Hanusia_phi.AAC.1
MEESRANDGDSDDDQGSSDHGGDDHEGDDGDKEPLGGEESNKEHAEEANLRRNLHAQDPVKNAAGQGLRKDRGDGRQADASQSLPLTRPRDLSEATRFQSGSLEGKRGKEEDASEKTESCKRRKRIFTSVSDVVDYLQDFQPKGLDKPENPEAPTNSLPTAFTSADLLHDLSSEARQPEPETVSSATWLDRPGGRSRGPGRRIPLAGPRREAQVFQTRLTEAEAARSDFRARAAHSGSVTSVRSDSESGPGDSVRYGNHNDTQECEAWHTDPYPH